jgi:hypothetical protein
MKNKIIIFLLFFSLFQGFSQEKVFDEYWLKSIAERETLEKKHFKNYGIVSMDSATTEKIRIFLYCKGSGIFSLDRIYRPYFYNIVPLISDSTYQMGIFMFGISGPHSGNYLLFKENEKLTFLDN